MAKKTIRDLNLAGKKVLIRVDFNVPQEDDGTISDDRRIRSALPTIQYALDQGAAAIVMSHLGRPTGDPKADAIYKMDRVAHRLAEFLPMVAVVKVDQVIGPSATHVAKNLQPGQLMVLENLRFHPGEKKGDPEYAKALRSLADIYVNDAFGTCHRKDGSMYAVPKEFPSGTRVIGFLVEKELTILDNLLHSPKKPMIGIMGGAKVSDKIAFIEAILNRVDQLLIGGAMTYTFRKAKGQSVGSSLVENDKLDLAKKLLDSAGDRLILPVDHLIADKPEASAKTKVVQDEIPSGWFGMDIGPQTIEQYQKLISTAATVVWNGPLGKFEDEPFRNGNGSIAEAMANSKAVTVVGGGESAEAVAQFGLLDRMTHVSTGGGAFLEYIEGKPFAPLEVIDNK